jgi:hypothetical protein
MGTMISGFRFRCMFLAVLLLVSHTLMAAHSAKHAGNRTAVDCKICLCQANEPHGMLPETIAVAGIIGNQEVFESVSPSPREGITIRAFLQRAPPSRS